MTRRLDTVVRIRRLQERLARGEVAVRRSALAARQHDEAARWAVVDDRSRIAPDTGAALAAHRAMLAGGVAVARRAGGEVVLARRGVERAMDGWSEAARRREGMERLADQVAAAERFEAERRAGIELDDLVIGRWNRSEA